MKALRRLACALPLLALLGAAVALADDEDDHDRARALVESGSIKPLDEILAHLPTASRGEVISVELDEDEGRYVYEIEILSADGRRIELEVDAASGTVRSGEGD